MSTKLLGIEIRDELGKTEWEQLEELAKSSPDAALSEFHDKVLEILERLVPTRKKRVGAKPKMHRMRRLLWKRHAKARRQFRSSSSIKKVTESMHKMWDLERQLGADSTASNKIEEDEAVMKMKSNPKTFFSFARARQKVKAMIGPFIDQLTGTPNPSPDFAAGELRKQYNSVFASPRPSLGS